MLRIAASVLIFGAGLVNLAPVLGVLSTSQLESGYGVALEDPNLVILMRHRAVLFAIVGGLLIASAFLTTLRPVAIAAGLVSMLSFILIAHLVGGFNAQLHQVIVADWIGLALLVAGAGAGFRNSGQTPGHQGQPSRIGP